MTCAAGRTHKRRMQQSLHPSFTVLIFSPKLFLVSSAVTVDVAPRHRRILLPGRRNHAVACILFSLTRIPCITDCLSCILSRFSCRFSRTRTFPCLSTGAARISTAVPGASVTSRTAAAVPGASVTSRTAAAARIASVIPRTAAAASSSVISRAAAAVSRTATAAAEEQQ